MEQDVKYMFLEEPMTIPAIIKILDLYSIDELQLFLEEDIISTTLALALKQYFIVRAYRYRRTGR